VLIRFTFVSLVLILDLINLFIINLFEKIIDSDEYVWAHKFSNYIGTINNYFKYIQYYNN